MTTHADLVKVAARWLLTRGRCCVVCTEVASGAGEEPDAIGWTGHGDSILIEVKASRADFRADRDKVYRQDKWQGIGDRRYYLAPGGLVSSSDIPPDWGLLLATGGAVVEVIGPRQNPVDRRKENRILTSLIRRIGKSREHGAYIKVYTYKKTEGEPRATLQISEDSECQPQSAP